MKQNYLKELMTALLLLCCTVASAQDFEVGGINYNILSSEDKTVEVTSDFNGYSGAVTIPASATYNSTTYSVTRIGDEAFAYCTGLTSIEIPSSVTSIGYYAFFKCTGLTSIVIPSSVTSIGNGAFAYCTGLTSIVVDEGNSVYDSRGNCNAIIETASNTLIAGCKNTIISEGVTSIGDYAFYGCSGLTSIVIPSSVTSIGNGAFSNCTGLTSIEIPSSVTSIGQNAFGNCTGLTSIEIPASVTSIGNNAFRGCTGLTSIVVGDGNSVYDSRGNCNAIIKTASNTLIAGCKNTIIPSSVTSIGNYVFSNCTGLTSIVIPSSVTSIGGYAFEGCTGLTSIEIPSSVTSIGVSAFEGCTGLTSIEIPSSVTSIGWYAFRDCTGLTSIEIPSSVTSIGYSAFNGCTGLTSIEIPNSVTSIDDFAFNGCTGLTSIVIPAGVTSIGMSAFRDCTGLTSIVSHIAAENLFAPEGYAFYGIDKDDCTLYVPAGAKSTYAATEQWKDFTNIVEAYDLTVTAAGYATLYLRKAVEIPAGVEAYTAGRIEGDLLKMQAVEDVIPAKTAVIIKAEEGNYLFAYSNETPDAIEGNLLRGTLTDTYIKPSGAQTAYVLSKVDGVVGMYRAKLKADGTFKNNANRAYMLLGEINVGEGDLDTSNPGGQLSNGYRFDFSGTTAIEGIQSEQGEAVYYDLSGRRVENPTKGIYIVNGRKVLIK